MPNHSRQDFQDRVRRIEERRAAEQQNRGSDPGTVRRARRKMSATLILTLATVAALGVLGFTLPYLADDLPEEWAFELPKVTWPPKAPERAEGSGGGFGVVSLMPQKTKRDRIPTEVEARNNGIYYPTGFVAGTPNPGDPLSLVASGFTHKTGSEIPLSVSTFPLGTECSFRPPQEDEIVLGANVTGALLPTAIRAITNEQLGRALNKSLAYKLEKPKSKRPITMVEGTVNMVNVFVTETAKPVYLVLQNMNGSTVWNLHTAPGAEIAHIALISGHGTGVLLDGQNIPIEALRISDFVTKHEYGRDDETRDCMIRPWPKPKNHWIAAQKAATGNMLYENQVETFAKGHLQYSRWFTAAFGVDPDEVSVTAEAAAHVVLGPVPDAPVPYRPVSRGDLHIVDFSHILTGDAEYLARRVGAINTDLLQAAIGGPLESLIQPIRQLKPEPAPEAPQQ